MSSEKDILSTELYSIGDQIDFEYVRMNANGLLWTGDLDNNEQIELVTKYNDILEKLRLLEENRESQSGGRYRKSRKPRKSRKNRKSRKKSNHII
jgi:hypothetical protein